jgi:prepilin-type processing-associated H-X9-DG protein
VPIEQILAGHSDRSGGQHVIGLAQAEQAATQQAREDRDVQDGDGDVVEEQAGDGLPVRAVGGDGSNYYDLLMTYLGNPQAWVCPSTHANPGRLMSYHMNGLIITTNGFKSTSIAEPAHTLLIGETGHKTRFDRAYLRPDQGGGYLYDRPQRNHSGGSNAAFVDGHVRWYHDSRWDSNSFRVVP